MIYHFSVMDVEIFLNIFDEIFYTQDKYQMVIKIPKHIKSLNKLFDKLTMVTAVIGLTVFRLYKHLLQINTDSYDISQMDNMKQLIFNGIQNVLTIEIYDIIKCTSIDNETMISSIILKLQLQKTKKKDYRYKRNPRTKKRKQTMKGIWLIEPQEE